MTRVRVRSDALTATSARLSELADVLRTEAGALADALARCRAPSLGLLGAWVRVEADALRVVGAGGLWGAALGTDVLAVRLSASARGYEEVERGVAAVMAGVHGSAEAAAVGGLLTEGGSQVVVRTVPPRWDPRPLTGPADLVALGNDLDGGRVRVVEVEEPDGGSAWVVVVPGTQEWGPRAGPNPFDLTSDVRAVTGDATLAAAGVEAALARARAASARARPDDPVLLVGHSQGGIHAAALASDPGFGARHRVTHVLTSGAPVALFPLPSTVEVLSVEHAEDPVPALDLTPNPERAGWHTVRAGTGPPVDVRRHLLDDYVRTTRAAQDAPRGVVPGVTAWEVSARSFLDGPVRSVTECAVERRAAAPKAPGADLAYRSGTHRPRGT